MINPVRKPSDFGQKSTNKILPQQYPRGARKFVRFNADMADENAAQGTTAQGTDASTAPGGGGGSGGGGGGHITPPPQFEPPE